VAYGVRADIYGFSNDGNFPIQNLHAYSVPLSIEYFDGTQPAAQLTLYPGFYFERDASFSSWDIPFQIATGIPLGTKQAAVIGIMDGRFYHQAIPILGLSYQITPKIHLDAVYPEPALTFRFDKWEAALAGELLGGGFLAGGEQSLTRMEYYDYHVEGTATVRLKNGSRLMMGAGYQIERVFNFYEEPRQFQAKGGFLLHVGLEIS
jgi:hypothetical protein